MRKVTRIRKAWWGKTIKKILAALLVISVISLMIMPKIAFATQEEEERGRQKAALSALVLIAIGVLILASNSNKRASLDETDKYADNKPDMLPQSSKDKDASMSVRLDFNDMTYKQDVDDESFMESEKEIKSPTIKLGYRW